jgi:CRP-like cAMP-binding protein
MERTDLTNGLICALDICTYEQLAPHLSHREFDRGDVFYEPGDAIEHIYFPHRGVISLLSVLEDGSAIETSTVGRESAVGLLAGLTPLQSFSRAVGQSAGLVSRIEAARLRGIAGASPTLRDVILRHCDALLANAQQSVACNALHDVEERFCRWLLTCHDRADGDELSVTQEFLAMMLGVQRTTVTQVAGMLQDARLIRYQRGRMTILDRPGLEHRACECYRAVRRHAEKVLPASPAEDGPCIPLSAEAVRDRAGSTRAP